MGILVTVTTKTDLYAAAAALSARRHLLPISDSIITMRHWQTDFICAVLPFVP